MFYQLNIAHCLSNIPTSQDPKVPSFRLFSRLEENTLSEMSYHFNPRDVQQYMRGLIRVLVLDSSDVRASSQLGLGTYSGMISPFFLCYLNGQNVYCKCRRLMVSGLIPSWVIMMTSKSLHLSHPCSQHLYIYISRS